MSHFKNSGKNVDEETDIYPTTSIANDEHRRESISDAVFGKLTEGGPDYRAVGQGWIKLTEHITNFIRWVGRELPC